MEGLEEGVAQPSEHYPGNPGVDPDPEWNDWQWPRDIATPENPTSSDIGHYLLYRTRPPCVYAELERRERGRERQDRDRHLLAKWSRGWLPAPPQRIHNFVFPTWLVSQIAVSNHFPLDAPAKTDKRFPGLCKTPTPYLDCKPALPPFAIAGGKFLNLRVYYELYGMQILNLHAKLHWDFQSALHTK